MPCSPGSVVTEFDFISSVVGRTPEDSCRGPLLDIEMSHTTATELWYSALAARTLLTDRAEIMVYLDPPSRVVNMCAAHWLDLAAEVGSSGNFHLALLVFMVVCQKAGWDFREIMNYLTSKLIELR